MANKQVMVSESVNILVVDDNPADRLMYRLSLQKDPDRKFAITEAGKGEAALEFCRSKTPDCVVLDFNLPNMDGLEFMAALKAEFGDLPCPIVMLTGVKDERARRIIFRRRRISPTPWNAPSPAPSKNSACAARSNGSGSPWRPANASIGIWSRRCRNWSG
jgi:CheY-like chemotaxis protein